MVIAVVGVLATLVILGQLLVVFKKIERAIVKR